ncbi:hypothetical protein DPX16_6628 [Anabarilius grahami]|uniref:Uncharacterized protein n=1 Tax=Anabarilius grahami TaxID=495550 RepID=A0A3N0Z1I2_ANAGA|nr:hypothetical protein DPX16_6628 [Anabarilius grahami]
MEDRGVAEGKEEPATAKWVDEWSVAVDRKSVVEVVGGAKVEPTGGRAETERGDQRLDEEPEDPLAQALMVVA